MTQIKRNPTGDWIRQRRKNFIRVIIAKIPGFITSYPKKEQELLLEFFDVLKNYDVDIVSSRDTFIKKVQTYLKKHEYSKIPFHWYANTFLQNALVYLNYSDLFGHPFYQYLVQQLRGMKDTAGLFELIKKQTPLEDADWEKLQYLAIRLIKPLTLVELTTLNVISQATYDSDEKGIDIKHYFKILAKTEYNTVKKIHKFAELLDLRWRILFYLPAFDLVQIAFKIQLTKDNVSIETLLNLTGSNISILRLSSMYRDRDNENTYTGIFIVPNYFINDFKKYLEECQENNTLNLINFDKIIQTQVSVAFNRYEANNGWKNLTKSETEELLMRLRNPRPRKPRNPLQFFSTTEPNQNWNYKQEEAPYSILTQFCHFFGIF
ncbi:MAG: hypothetical protein ACTSPV_07220, partial [Candidatus Hodarchaeales archaeon]